jgi:hypothetical protein
MFNMPPDHRYCPYLGLRADRTSIFSEPTEEHRCHVTERQQEIDLSHQAAFCLTSTFEACPRFVPQPVPEWKEPEGPAGPEEPDVSSGPSGSFTRWPWLMELLAETSILEIGVWIGMAVFVLAVVYLYLMRPLTQAAPPDDTAVVAVVPSSSLTLPQPPGRAPSPVGTPVAPAVATAAESTPAPAQGPGGSSVAASTLIPGRLQAALVPAGNAVGWVSSGDPLNHFGDRNLHVGVFEGHVYYGAMQFSLASIPAGSRIEQATVELMGLSAENLGTEGTWTLHLLSPEADVNWESVTYERIHTAPVADTIPPELSSQDLAARRVNVFAFTPAQRAELEHRLSPQPAGLPSLSGRGAGGEGRMVSFRLDGPSEGANNLFTWDTGYGGGFGNRPVLRVIYVPPPTLTPIFVTPSATPGNILTVAAAAMTATYVATTTGTPTPWPTNVVVLSGSVTPGIAVIVDTPTPGNQATATYVIAEATARAFLYGTPTPWPTDAVTATPLPTAIVVTSTPTPANVVTVAAMSARATALAAAKGTATPAPPNLATPTQPLVITNTPTPANTATAAWVATLRAAEALVYGTPTPLPPWAITATPVPLLVYLNEVTVTPSPTTTGPAPVRSIPPELRGKILFLSDRLEHEQPDVLLYDPATGRIALVTQPWAYDRAQSLESLSPDGMQRVIVRSYHNDSQLWLENTADGWQTYLTGELGGADYEPAWQPGGPLIAYVAQQDLNDEIYVFNKDTQKKRRLTINTWEWDKHPTWSPDGKQIVFWSNRQTSRKQIWIMNADGSDQRLLFQDDWNNWDPVWVK